jgi:DNA-directed RNA polymerase subunit RPC12/RpoP
MNEYDHAYRLFHGQNQKCVTVEMALTCTRCGRPFVLIGRTLKLHQDLCPECMQKRELETNAEGQS